MNKRRLQAVIESIAASDGAGVKLVRVIDSGEWDSDPRE